MLRKIVTSSGGICLAATAVKVSDSKSDKSDQQYVCKPSELPIYVPLHERNARKTAPPHPATPKTVSYIESGISSVRSEITGVYKAFSAQKKHVDDAIEKGKNQTKFIYDYLNEPDNTAPRVGAIAIGGLAGLIFSLRGGLFRRIIYTAIGAGGMASVCYPKDAEMYAQHGIVEAKRMANIAYNFTFGVKPGDDVNSSNWTKIPTNFTDIKDSISDLAQSAKDAVMSSKK